MLLISILRGVLRGKAWGAMDDAQKTILDTIDANSERLISFAEDIYQSGEPGFREFNTAQKFSDEMDALGLECKKGLAITGVKASLGRKGINIAAVGELDGIACPHHEYANPDNGISHACGHNIQLTALLGSAIALSVPEVAAQLGGNAAFFAVPSEEFTDLDYKKTLIRQGKISFGGGKSELVSIGAFDDINMCITHHLHMVKTKEDVLLGYNTTNGFIVKQIDIKGKSSHAAIAPEKGINAINAASLGLSALAYQRETFRDTDFVRVHAIITKGGDVVNVVPSNVTLEAQIRAKTMSAMMDASHKTNRSFESGAHALGARVTIHDLPGYLPILEYPVPKAMIDAGRLLKDEVSIERANPKVHNSASTDVGDLSHLMPTLGFTTGGFSGDLHSANFEITDKYKAYILPAKIMALTMYNLLKDDAAEAKQLVSAFPQHLTKQEYLEYLSK